MGKKDRNRKVNGEKGTKKKSQWRKRTKIEKSMKKKEKKRKVNGEKGPK